MQSEGWSAVAGRVMLGLGSWMIACAPAHALGYEDFTLNWLTSDGKLVSVYKKREVTGSIKRDPKTNYISSVAFVFQMPDSRDSCTMIVDEAIECESPPRLREKTIYRYVKAEKFDELGRGRFQNEPGRIYKQFRARHAGKGTAAGYFECRAYCDGKPRWIVPVYLGD